MSGMWMEGWYVDFVAGWVSGAASVVVCQPMDTVLTRFQAGQSTATVTAVAAGSKSGGELRLATLGSSFRVLAREFGIGYLWRGSSPMIGVVPFQNALLMGGYGFGKQYSDYSSSRTGTTTTTTGGDDDTNRYTHGLLPVFVGGCAGGVLQSFLVSPIEWIKVHQQTMGGHQLGAAKSAATYQSSSSSTSSLARTLLQHRGSLWNRGLTATLLRDGIPHGVWFASYELCKVELLRANSIMSSSGNNNKNDYNNHNDDELSSTVSSPSDGYYESVAVPLVSGALAATTAWAVGYPFDIIKTRIQVTTILGTPSSKGGIAVPGIVETAKQLVAEADGQIVRGLYRGFGLKLARSIPASMIGFLTYEVISEGLTH